MNNIVCIRDTVNNRVKCCHLACYLVNEWHLALLIRLRIVPMKLIDNFKRVMLTINQGMVGVWGGYVWEGGRLFPIVYVINRAY